MTTVQEAYEMVELNEKIGRFKKVRKFITDNEGKPIFKEVTFRDYELSRHMSNFYGSPDKMVEHFVKLLLSDLDREIKNAEDALHQYTHSE